VATYLKKEAENYVLCGDLGAAGLKYAEAGVILRTQGLLRSARDLFAKAEQYYNQANASESAQECAQICEDLEKEIAAKPQTKKRKNKMLRTDIK
jgi:hypothetical protein